MKHKIKRIACVLAVVFVMAMTCVTAFAETVYFTDPGSYRACGFPAGLSAMSPDWGTDISTAIVRAAPTNAIPSDFSATVSHSEDSAGKPTYSVTYHVLNGGVSTSPNEYAPYGVYVPYAAGYVVTARIYYYHALIDFDVATGCRVTYDEDGNRVLGDVIPGIRRSVEASAPVLVKDADGVVSVVPATGSNRGAIVMMGGVNLDYYITISVTPEEYFTLDEVTAYDDANGILAYPFNSGLTAVLSYFSTLSTSPVIAPICYGAAFIMLAAMVLKMML